MNIGSISIAAGAAASSAAARSSETARAADETNANDRTVEAAREAAEAAGIGTTHEEQAAGDRDGDGRDVLILGEEHRPKREPEETQDEPQEEHHHSLDPSGKMGTRLDLDG